ncbi:MAG: hypothetical protein LW595_00660 [Rickettsiales bacterium]|jgi:hypothetical protein|nr:hypothetical protein [Rickettsiales bacterium]
MKIAKKAILLFVSLFVISACVDHYAIKEIKKTNKANSASSRINSSEDNSEKNFKTLNEEL